MATDCKLWLVATAIALTASAARAADDFPYTAYVAIDGAEIVAGPGQRFYATGHLRRGTQVEVYREEASGWLAIRPTDESFSWIAAAAIERSATDAQAGRVTTPTPAWIGTAVEHVTEHRQQVTLKEGELVQILGEKNVASAGAEPQIWLKIAPPAGEFRWIHLRDVSRQMPPPIEPEPEVAAAEEPQRAPPVEPQRLEATGQAMTIADIERPAARRSSPIERAQFQSPSSPADKTLSPDGFVPRKRPGSEHLQPSATALPQPRASIPIRTQPAATAAPRVAEARPAPAASRTDDIAAQLERIELDLSLMVAQDKSLWDLGGIKTRVRDVVERGSDPAGRGRARLLLDKVEQFERAFAVQDYGPIRTASSASAGNRPATGPLADPRYDAQGWLKPVVSRQGDKPIAPYAVVDEDGQPLCFVTPQPGLNLRAYENKQVGVYGRRGFLEELKKPHVTAREVIDLRPQWR